MPGKKLRVIKNISRVHQISIELSDGNTLYLAPQQEAEDVEVMNLGKIKNTVRYEEASKKVVNLNEVNPPRAGGRRMSLVEVNPRRASGVKEKLYD